MSTTARIPPSSAARMNTGRPPSPRTRRAAIARPVSCSRGRKNPGPQTKSRAQNTESGANLAVPSARAATTRKPYCMSPARPSPTATGIVPAGTGRARSRSKTFMTSPGVGAPLRVDASHRSRVGDALDRHQVRAEAERHMMPVGLVAHLPERLLEDLLEPDVDLVLLPEEGLQVLDPLEVRHRDATGVGEDVRNHRDPAPLQDAV